MPVHLPDENYITDEARANMAQLLSDPSLRKTMLTEWFVANKNNPHARNLTYCEFPSKWRWDDTSKVWKPRQTTKSKIGRLYYVHPLASERYYLRMLLLTVKGACRDGNGVGTERGEQMPAHDNTRGHSSSPPMTIPVGKIPCPCPYPSGNGRVSGTRGYYIVLNTLQ
jgi:hypothetical protein